MKTPLSAVFDVMRRPFAVRTSAGTRDRHSGPTLAQIIAALDDRDTRSALELLDPPPANAAAAPERRMKCAGGCGE